MVKSLFTIHAKTNMPLIHRSFYLLSARSVFAIFFVTERIVLPDGLSLLLQRYVRKGSDAKNPAILRFFFVIVTETNTFRAFLPAR